MAPGGRYVGLVYTADARIYVSLGMPEALAEAAAAGVTKYEEIAFGDSAYASNERSLEAERAEGDVVWATPF